MTIPGPLAPGASMDIDWTVSVPAGVAPGEVAWNSFAVAADRADTSEAIQPTEPPKVGIAVPLSDVSLTKDVDRPSVAVGEEVTYTIRVAHDGTFTYNADGSVTYSGAPTVAESVEVTDVMPPGVSLIPGSSSTLGSDGLPAGTFDEGTGVWAVGDLAPNDWAELTYRATVDALGAHTNTAQVTANSTPDVDSVPANGDLSEDDLDEAVVTAEIPGLELEKLVEDTGGSGVFIEADADDGDLDAGVYESGEPVTYQFVVTNPGAGAIADVTVTDPTIDFFCGPLTLASLAGGASHTFTCTWPLGWPTGDVTNTATATGTDIAGNPVGDTDTALVQVGTPAITVEKSTNGADADLAADAVAVQIGDPITWTYVITNSGTEPLTGVSLADDREPGVSIAEPACTRSDGLTGAAFGDPLAPGATITCTHASIAAPGAYANLATAAGTGAVTSTLVQDTDPSHYLAPIAAPSLSIEKATNGVDADTPALGEALVSGDPVTWTYVITNDGNTPLEDLTLSDDREAAVALVEPECTRSDGLTGPDFADPLPTGATVTCTHVGTVGTGAYANTATATASGAGSPVGPVSDPSHHIGTTVSVGIEKATNGVDADLAGDAVEVVAGDPIAWSYVITNTGQDDLTNLELDDDREPTVGLDPSACVRSDAAPVSNPLPAGESITCTFAGVAAEGLYVNTGTVSADGLATGVSVGDDDPSHYLAPSATASIQIEKATDGVDADTPGSGPIVEVGEPVVWTYVIVNTGPVPLSSLDLSDDVETSVGLSPDACVASTSGAAVTDPLPPGGAITCTHTGVAGRGAYSNIGTVTAQPPTGDPVEDQDPSHHVGVAIGIELEKSTDGIDADSAADAVQLAAGASLEWQYAITNTGDLPIESITLADDRESGVGLEPAACVRPDGLDLTAPLPPGATITCTHPGRAAYGAYVNVGTVGGFVPALGGAPVGDDDPSHHIGLIEGTDVSVTKAAVAREGVDLAWEVGITNGGSEATTPPLVVQDDLRDEMSLNGLVAEGWNCSVDGRRIRCEWPTAIQPGERVALGVLVRLAADDLVVANEALAETGGREVTLDNNSSTAVHGPGDPLATPTLELLSSLIGRGDGGGSAPGGGGGGANPGGGGGTGPPLPATGSDSRRLLFHGLMWFGAGMAALAGGSAVADDSLARLLLTTGRRSIGAERSAGHLRPAATRPALRFTRSWRRR